jgi:hypothetical protein
MNSYCSLTHVTWHALTVNRFLLTRRTLTAHVSYSRGARNVGAVEVLGQCATRGHVEGINIAIQSLGRGGEEGRAALVSHSKSVLCVCVFVCVCVCVYIYIYIYIYTIVHLCVYVYIHVL